MEFNVAVVIVTYNRLQKLKTALKCYDNQILKPKHIIVVNNNSTDGTMNYLVKWSRIEAAYKKHVVHLEENLGGSGGFYEGEKYALNLVDVNWIMIADDDAYPESNYINGMQQYILLGNDSRIAVVCGKVFQNDSFVNIHRTFWRSRWNWNFHRYATHDEYKDVFEPDFVSYVGILISRNALEKVGLVQKDLYIWNDDTEHSYRLKKYGKIICLPKYTIHHDVSMENDNLSWKTFYGYRNKVFFFKKHFVIQLPFVLAFVLSKAVLCPFRGKSFTEVKVRVSGILNGLMGNLGKHPVYKPGWKP